MKKALRMTELKLRFRHRQKWRQILKEFPQSAGAQGLVEDADKHRGN